MAGLVRVPVSVLVRDFFAQQQAQRVDFEYLSVRAPHLILALDFEYLSVRSAHLIMLLDFD